VRSHAAAQRFRDCCDAPTSGEQPLVDEHDHSLHLASGLPCARLEKTDLQTLRSLLVCHTSSCPWTRCDLSRAARGAYHASGP